MNSEELLASLDRARYGAEQNTYALLKTIALELWLRSFEQHSRVTNFQKLTETSQLQLVPA
jgi:hypothetical protein